MNESKPSSSRRSSSVRSGAILSERRPSNGQRALWLLCALAAGISLAGCAAEESPRGSDRTAEQALESALTRPPGVERVRDYVDALTNLDSATAGRLADLLASSKDKIPAYELRLVHATWARTDADAALGYVLALDATTAHRTNVAAEVIRTVAASDPAKARSWLQSLSEDESEEFRTALAVALIEGWPAAETGTEGVTELLETIPIGFARDRAVGAIVENLIDAGKLDGAMSWAETIDVHAPGQLRSLAFRKVAQLGGPGAPLRVAEWLDGYREHRYGQAGLRVLARAWGYEDSEAALEWAMAQPDDRGRFLSLKFAFQSLYETDKPAAIEWIQAQPASDVMDTPRMTFALAHVYADPALAAEQARAIEDETERDDTLAKVFRTWLGKDRESARAWIDSSGLPQSYWVELLTPRQSPTPAPSPSPTPTPTPDEIEADPS